jgi:hypothetical protein
VPGTSGPTRNRQRKGRNADNMQQSACPHDVFAALNAPCGQSSRCPGEESSVIRTYYPGAAAGRMISLGNPIVSASPKGLSDRPARIVLFEACSAFLRVTACTLALSPFVTRVPKA